LGLAESLAVGSEGAAVSNARVRIGTISGMLGSTVANLGRHARAQECFRRAIVVFSELARIEPERREYSRDLARAKLRLARELEHDAPEEAVECARAVMDLWGGEVADFPSSPYLRWELSYARSEFVRLSASRGRLASVIEIVEEDADEMGDVVARHPDVSEFRCASR